MFADEEECVRAVLGEGVERISQAVDEATRTVADFACGQTAWVARVRAGLVALLGFLDDEPAWGRLLFLQAPRMGATRSRPGRGPSDVVSALIEYSANEGIGNPPQLTTELVAGGVSAVVRARIADPDETPLVELAPSLMAFVVTPYLGQAAASAELVGTSESRVAMSSELYKRPPAAQRFGAAAGDERVSPRGRWVPARRAFSDERRRGVSWRRARASLDR